MEEHSGRAVGDVTGKIRRGQTRQGLFEATIDKQCKLYSGGSRSCLPMSLKQRWDLIRTSH